MRAAMTTLSGTNIGGYSVLELVGSGGMGVVYRALHTKLGRVAAIKVLHQDGSNTRRVEGFLREARLQATLRHPGIATLYDFIEHDNQLCIVMEFVEGPTLTEHIQTRGPLPVSEALSILRAVDDAVAYLHSQGVIHRDIKSSNIKLCPDGTIKLLDFGIARTAGSRATTGPLTGTFEYVSPEQFGGQAADQRADIWALGILLYEMVTARLPFDGRSIADLRHNIEHNAFVLPSQHNPRVGHDTEELIARCLRKRPSERFQSLDELQQALSSQSNRSASHRLRLVQLISTRWVMGVASATLISTGVFLFNAFGSSNTTAADGAKTVDVDVVNGPAEVYREGHDLGATPIHVKGRWGEHVTLVFRRKGFNDLPVDFDIDERSSYSYALEAAAQSR